MSLARVAYEVLVLSLKQLAECKSIDSLFVAEISRICEDLVDGESLPTCQGTETRISKVLSQLHSRK